MAFKLPLIRRETGGRFESLAFVQVAGCLVYVAQARLSARVAAKAT